jgi:hypothetical protein
MSLAEIIRVQVRRVVAHNFQQRWSNDDFGPKANRAVWQLLAEISH